MKKIFKSFLSLLIVCSLILTTNSMVTFAEGLNSDVTESTAESTMETTIETTTKKSTEETTKVIEKVSELNAIDESTVSSEEEEEECESTDYEEEPEEETTIEESSAEETTIEETTVEETTVEETTIEESLLEETTTNSNEETTVEGTNSEETTIEKKNSEETTIEESLLEETTIIETISKEITIANSNKNDVLFGIGDTYTFKFIVPGAGQPNPFGWFNSEGGPQTIEYSSEDIATNPVVIPVFYPAAWSGGWTDPDWINVGWINESNENQWISDDDLNTLVDNWTANPTENITIRINMSQIWNSSLKTPPEKISYFVGEEIDPTGLVFEVSDEITDPATWTKDIAYDEPQFGRLYSYQLLDESEAVIEGNTVTAETKYCKFIYNVKNEHKVELTVRAPHTFTFVTNELYPENFGYFDEAHTINVITYHSEQLDTNPVEIPLVYNIAYQDTGAWIDIGWLLYKGEGQPEEWISDEQLNTLVENWQNNPSEDVRVRVNFDPIYHSSLRQRPNKINYVVGEEIDPTGLVIEVSNEIFDPPTWTKDIAYDAIQYRDLFARELLDADKNSIGWDTVTENTKYCRFRFKTSVYEDVELTVRAPHTFTFVTNEVDPSLFGYFDAAHTVSRIDYRSEELDTTPIEFPLVYNAAFQDYPYIDVGWIRERDGSDPEYLSDSQLRDLINSWSESPDEDVFIKVRFETIYHSSLKTPPDRVDYYIGDEIDPTGVVIEVSDEIADPPTWTKDVSYDAVQYRDLFTVELLDRDKNVITGNTVTLETKYCRFHYNVWSHADVEISILKNVTEISIKKEQDWREYSTGERFDPKGLVINVKYDDNTTGEVAYNDKRVLFLFNPFVLTADTSQVNVIFGGQTAPTHVTMVDNAYVLYYYNKTTDSVHSIYTYSGDENNVISALDSAVSQGAKGFYRINAEGYHDGYNKYDKDTIKTLTRDEALSVYREEYDGNSSIYIGASFYEPTPPTPPTPPSPTPTPVPYNPGGSGGSSSGGSSSPSVGPMGDLTKNPMYQQQLMQQGQINSTNNIPQNSLIFDTNLAISLLSAPENANMPKSNIIDLNGNTGFGRWAKVPGTTTWYFLSGDMSANGTNGTSGFVSNGLYNLSWGTTSGWYSFSALGVMQTGWQQVNGRMYYFEPNPSDVEFGKAIVGSKVINGVTYNFDANGALVQ